MAVFASRQIVMPVVQTPIGVEITGSGNSIGCYAIINGTTQYSAGIHEVNVGDTITFGVFGSSFSTGYVKIEGTIVIEVTGDSTQTYDWTVPSGISTIEIAMQYTNTALIRFGRITVTTA